MRFLDRLFGRAKETTGDVADKGAPVVDEAEDSAARTWDTATDAAGDAAHETKDKVSDLADRGEDEAAGAADTASDSTGSSPPAA